MNNQVLRLDTSKYSKDGPFSDPVVRCDACQKLCRVETLRQTGKCVCGNRKVRNVNHFTIEEQIKMEAWGIDTDFLALFESVEDLDG